MAPFLTQSAKLRNTQIACGGMVPLGRRRKIEEMKRQKLIDARKRRKLNQEAIAERMGVSVAQVSRWETGKDGIPSQRLTSLAGAYEASIGELLDEEAGGIALPFRTFDVVYVPLVGRAPAGNWREAIHCPIGQVAVKASVAGKNSFAVEVDGDSMNMILPEGGWAVVDPGQRHFFDGKVYLVMNGDHEATMKRYKSNPARLVPVSTNDLHGDIMLGDPITIIGRIVAYGNDEGL